MNTEIQTTENQDLEIIAKKGAAWSAFGQELYKNEIQLQARAQQLILKLKNPKTIEEVSEAEKILKEVKSEAIKIDEDRKVFTKRFDEVASRLMQPKKLVDEQAKVVETSIISVKSAYAKIQQQEQAKIDELKRLKEFVINCKAQVDATFKTKINDTIEKAYSYALNDGKVTMETLDSFIETSLTKFTAQSFMADLPARQLILVSKEEYDSIANEHFTWSSLDYLNLYSSGIKAKFLDFNIALQNKEAALKLSQEQAEAKEKEIAQNVANAQTAAKLESIAQVVTPTVSVEVKALKSVYEIDMPDNVQSILSIMSAFSANLDLCLPKLKVSKWFAFTPLQAGNALAKVKCDDNNFAPTGITFKEVNKL